MLRMFWNSKTALNAMNNKLDVISNNLANINTVGYKKAEVSFTDLMQESFERKGYPVSNNDNLSTGSGVKSTEITRNKSQGMLKETGVKTNFAIDGNGFFKVYLSDGSVAYTRSGDFKIDASGNMVDSNGNLLSIVDDYGNEINKQLNFTDGNYSVDIKGDLYKNFEDRSVKIGSIGVYEPKSNNSLKSIGNSLYKPVDNVEIQKSSDYSVYQGFLETSNVDLTEEMTDMIMTQRAFQLNSTALKTSDQMWEMVNNLSR